MPKLCLRGPFSLHVRALAAALTSCVLAAGLLHTAACGDAAQRPAGPGHEGTRPPAGDDNLPPATEDEGPVANVLAPAPSPEHHAAAQTFVALCSACHGDWGEGSSAPSLQGLGLTRAELVQKIDLTMPPKDPTLCSGPCAEQMADYLLEELAGEALACEGIRPAPRQLRLLNRREYANTVRTLLGGHAAGEPPSGAAGSHTFSFAPGAQVASVHVAGTFNEWSDTAWPMSYDAAQQRYVLTRELAPGQHEFKYVVRAQAGGDAQWLPDPTLPQAGAHGNSVLTVAAASEGDDPSMAFDFSTLPSETRPLAFPFDTTVTSVVGTQQFEAYFDTAKKVARAVHDLAALVGCDFRQDRAGCGRTFLSAFGKRVFRRALSNVELERYLALFMLEQDADQAVRTVLAALLTSPHFLYRSELGTLQADGTYLLTPHELASALSYTFLANMPDELLFAAAERGELGTSEQLRAQAERLLAMPEARPAITAFALEWLGVDGVSALSRDPQSQPAFTPSLRESMQQETARFAEHVLFESTGTVRELLSADYTFANAELAALYGLPGAFDDTLRKQPYGDTLRAGVLGHASVLATYAHANQTSPVLRGLFVRRQVLCQRFGEPPPNAGAVPELDPALSTRERFDMHSTEACASCHVHIDPLGFGFEHFDEIGRHRTEEAGHAVDAAGELSGAESLRDGSRAPFGSPRELATLLLASPATHTCVAKQSYRFIRGALDSGLQYCALKFVRSRYRESRGRVLEALLASVEAVDFRYRY